MSNIEQIDKEIQSELQELSKNLPRFEDGRINYKDSKKALALTCFVKFKDKILLLKRSDKVATYKGMWNTVAGYIDDNKPFKEKVLEELKEEIGITENEISEFKFGNKYQFTDESINKTWVVYPVLVILKEELEIKLDREHTEFKWILLEEINNYGVVPNLDKSLGKVLIR